MAKYRFPESIILGFERISKLSSSQALIIAKELNSSQFGLDSDKVVESLKTETELKEIGQDVLISIVKTVYSLLRIDYKSDEEKQKRINDLSDSVAEQVAEEARGISIDADKLMEHLLTFLSISGKIKSTIKGFQLLQDNQRNMVGSKINTDVRIVFEEDIDNTMIENAVIVHNLMIEYLGGSKIKEAFFALNTNDLLDLKDTIERAIRKESILRKPNSISSLKFLSLEKNDK